MNFEEFESKHYVLKEVKKLISPSFIAKVTLIDIPQEFRSGKFKLVKNAYLREEVDKLAIEYQKIYGVEFIDVPDYKTLDENYCTFKEMKEVLSSEHLGKVPSYSFPKELAIDRFEGAKRIYKKVDLEKQIEIYKKNKQKFYENSIPINVMTFEELERDYYTFIECKSLISGHAIENKIQSYSIPSSMKKGKFKGKSKAYLKEEVDNLAKSSKFLPKHITDSINTSNKYMHANEVLELLKISTSAWIRTRNEFNLQEDKRHYYLKSEIEKIYKLQQEFLDNYVSEEEFRIIKSQHLKEMISYEIPCYAYVNKFKSRTRAYKKSQLEEFILKGYAKKDYYIEQIHNNKSNTFFEQELKEFMDNHYTYAEVYEILSQKYAKQIESIDVPIEFRVGKFQNKNKCYAKEQILMLKSLQDNDKANRPITQEELDTGKYINIQEIIELLGITRQQWQKLRNDQNIEYFRKGYVVKWDIEKILKEFEDFSKDHCTYEEAVELLVSPYFDKLTPIRLTRKLRLKKYSDKRFAYSINEVNQKIKDGHGKNNINLNEYYHLSDVLEMLDLHHGNVIEVLNEEGVYSVKYMNKSYYKKSEIDNLKKQQQDFIQNHLSYVEASEIVKRFTWVIAANDIRVNIRPIFRVFKFKSMHYAFPKKEFLEYINKKEDYILFSENFFSTDVTKEFRKKLEIYPEFKYEEMEDKYKFATKLMLDFFDEKLINSTRSIRNSNILVKLFVKIIGKIYDMLEKSNATDIHTLKTSDIMEFLLNTLDIEKKYIIEFLEYTHATIVYDLNKGKSFNKKIFDIDKISKKFRVDRSNKELLDADIYDLETFLEMMNYCKDIHLHTKICLEGLKSDSKALHVSQWLFVSINLNNGWRMEDLSKFPVLHLRDILDEFEIYNLDWFKDNTLSLEQSRIILSRLYNHKYVVNKTQEYNGFFVSDDLCPSVATAYTMLTLYRESEIGIDNDYIMQFGTDFNYPSSYAFRYFFKDFSIKDFTFGSNKTTSTLLTFMDCIKVDDCDQDMLDGEILLQLQANIRSHKSLMSTLNYLKLNPEKFDELTKNLFRRGEFGYIYASISNKLGLNIKNLKNTNEVDEVILLPHLSNSPWNIEIATGILNNADKERKEVLSQIDKMNFEQILGCFNDIVLKKNPSREEGILCFIGANNCNEEKKDCVKCKNAIVTIYALNTIAKRLVNLLLEYHSTEFIGEKMKLAHTIFYYKERIKEAMAMYGREVVYSYMQLEKADFLHILRSIKTKDELLKERGRNIC